MTSTKTSSRAFLATYLFRPAIVEAKLMTAKHARDAVYVATLAEELRAIDSKLSAMESAQQVELPPDPEAARPRPCRMPEDGPDADWIREKSDELDLRLRRIEQNIPVSSARGCDSAGRNKKRAPAKDALYMNRRGD